MTNVILIGLGSALGGMARYGVQVLAAARWGQAFPFGTITANVSGSFLIGLVFAVTEPLGRWPADVAVRHFFMTGLLGGYTTFSSFSLQTLNLAREGQMGWAILNAVSSVLLCLLAVWLGHAVGQWINK